jgi:hypothetical protein
MIATQYQPTQPANETAAELTDRYRPAAVRVLFVGESSPAGETHFYRGNSPLFRATRDAFQAGLGAPLDAPFLEWFRDLGCWLVDLADAPFDELPAAEQSAAIDAAIARLTATLQDLRPERVVVVLRRIAPAVQEAADEAGLLELPINVLPYPTRQWRPVYIEELAGIVAEVLNGELAESVGIR